jgi:SAM-dependent methyltransferase
MISTKILSFLNNLFPPRRVEGRKSPLEYSQAEYNWAAKDDYLKFLDLKEKIVLDAGCGLGGRTIFYYEKGVGKLYAIDIDPNHIKFAKDFAEKKGISDIDFIISPIHKTNFSSNYFDIIILHDVLEHIRADLLEKSLIELFRILKPGGKIYIQFPPWTSPFAAHLYDYINIPWCHYLFNEKTLINFIEKNKEVKRFGKLSYIEHFKELNKIDYKKFLKLMDKTGFKKELLTRRVIKNIRILSYLPFVNELLTLRIIAIYTK